MPANPYWCPVCGVCGLPSFRAACAHCPPERSANKKRRYWRRKAEGGCATCGVLTFGYTYCLECQEKRNGVTRDVRITVEREADGRWLVALPDHPGVMAYGTTRAKALHAALAIPREGKTDE